MSIRDKVVLVDENNRITVYMRYEVALCFLHLAEFDSCIRLYETCGRWH